MSCWAQHYCERTIVLCSSAYYTLLAAAEHVVYIHFQFGANIFFFIHRLRCSNRLWIHFSSLIEEHANLFLIILMRLNTQLFIIQILHLVLFIQMGFLFESYFCSFSRILSHFIIRIFEGSIQFFLIIVSTVALFITSVAIVRYRLSFDIFTEDDCFTVSSSIWNENVL